MSIITDQATFDRWVVDGRWVEFTDEAPPCEGCMGLGTMVVINGGGPDNTMLCVDCGGSRISRSTCRTCFGYLDTKFDNPMPDCPTCGGSGKQRHTVQVPCPDTSCIGRCSPPGLVTVARATVEWGPLRVMQRGTDTTEDHLAPHRDGLVIRRFAGYTAPLSDVATVRTWDSTETVTLPPGIGPADLIGKWARGGTIEATS